jgi:hypothetical protein
LWGRSAYKKDETAEGCFMKKTFIVALLMLLLLSLTGCASDTATTQQQKKPVGWGTVDTIESESVR